MIKMMYSVFLGLVIVMFVGVGVSTFYTSPVMPDNPVERELSYIEGEPTDEQIVEIEAKHSQYDAERDQYDADMKDYSRNVAIITMIIATVLLVLSITQAEKFVAISEGVLLGGIFTLFYSLVRGLMSGDDMARFMVITIGLLIALWLGKTKFMPEPKKAKK